MDKIPKPPLAVKPEYYDRLFRVIDLTRALYEYTAYNSENDKWNRHIDYMIKWANELERQLIQMKSLKSE